MVTPTDILNICQPFPKLRTPTPPSLSPPHTSNMPAVTISPASEDRKISPTVPPPHHIHAYTPVHIHFCPKFLPSKLAAPQIPAHHVCTRSHSFITELHQNSLLCKSRLTTYALVHIHLRPENSLLRKSRQVLEEKARQIQKWRLRRSLPLLKWASL